MALPLSSSLKGLQAAVSPDLAKRNLLFPWEDQSATDSNAVGGGIGGMAAMNSLASLNGPDDAAFDPNSPANKAKRYNFYVGRTPFPVDAD